MKNSLKDITKGSLIIFIGTALGLGFAFLVRVILAKYTTQTEYGLYNLAFTIVTIFVTLSMMGLGEGTTRYIGCFLGRNDQKKVKDVIISSTWIALFSSIFFALLSYHTADFIGINIYNSIELANVIKIFSISIPFVVFVNILVAIFRGFNNIDVKIWFNDILKPIIHVIFILTVVFVGFNFIEMVYAYVLSTILLLIIFVAYILKKYRISLDKYEIINCNSLIKHILYFSAPLLIINLLLTVMSWTDTLMIGYFKSPEDVGAYNAALPLASLLKMTINSMGFLYVPIMSQLYGGVQRKTMVKGYVILTKWLFIGTIPIFFILFTFSGELLTLFFGPRYFEASTTLQVLSLGFVFNSLFGLNYYTLISTGKSKYILYCSLISTLINIPLNIALIPSMGILGAAIASAISFVMIEVLMTMKLHTFLKSHPFTKNYMAVITLTFSLVLFFYFIKNLVPITILMASALSIVFILIYAIVILVTTSFDKEDFVIKYVIEKLEILQGRR